MVAVSNLVAEKVRRARITQSPEVIYPPTNLTQDCNSKSRAKPSHLNVATVSRIAPEKGLGFLTPLARECKKAELPATFNLVGAATDVGYRDKVVNSFEGRVNFLGQKTGKDLCLAYNQADVTVFPSTNEAFGLVTVESLQHGAPVISRNAAAGEITSNQVGTVVDRDEALGISQAMCYMGKLLDESGFMEAESEAAFAVGKKFNSGDLVTKFVDFVTR